MTSIIKSLLSERSPKLCNIFFCDSTKLVGKSANLSFHVVQAQAPAFHENA